MQTESEIPAVLDAPRSSNVEQTESTMQVDSPIVNEATATDENVEEMEVVEEEGGDRSSEIKPAPEIIQQESQEKDTQTDEEKRARKERLKQARNIRFSTGETVHKKASTTDMVIEEIIDHESSTAITTPTRRFSDHNSSSDLEEMVVPDIMEEDDADMLLNIHSDDDDEDETLRESVKGGDSVRAKGDFLENFEIPSLTDISVDDEDELSQDLKTRLSSQRVNQSELSVDPGKFVDPLTGDALTPSSPTESIESLKESSSSSSSSSEEWSDFDSLLSFKTETTKDEDVFHQFEIDLVLSTTKFETVKRSSEKKLSNDAFIIAYDFLNNLINNLVTNFENVKIEHLLNKNVDKFKLHAKISDEVSQYYCEKGANEYLNTKMMEYYRRMKNYRVFSKLPPELSEKEYKRYMEALIQLDYNLHFLAQSKKKNSYLISSVLMDLAYAQNICLQSEESLTEKIKNTLGHKSEYIKRITERELRLMDQKRYEISDTRLDLITRKHTLGRIADVCNIIDFK